MSGPADYEACASITAGPDPVFDGTADAGLIARASIVLVGDVGFQTGAVVELRNDPQAATPPP